VEVNGYTIEPGADLIAADLDGADLRGANLKEVDLRAANLMVDAPKGREPASAH